MPAGSARRGRWLAAALLAAAAGAHADFREDYSRGLAALKDGNYAEARQLLQKALSAQPEAALRVRLYGQRWEPYLPQHYLGVAAFRMGDCAAALALWNSAENKQTIGQVAELQGEQQRDIAECSKTLVAKKGDEAAPAKAATPAPGETKPAESKTAGTKSAESRAAETKSSVAAAAAPESAAKAADASAKAPAELAKTAPPATAEAAKPASSRPAAAPQPVPADASPSAPPDSLIAAFDKYLAGRYSDVAAIDPNGYRDARSRYHAFLLRAAARYTLSQVGGDDSLAEAARDDIRAARAANAKGSPDATMFSPRFRNFFAQSR